MAANAQLTVEMASIRCEQYLAMTPSQSRDFSSWIGGDLLAHQKNIANVKASFLST